MRFQDVSRLLVSVFAVSALLGCPGKNIPLPLPTEPCSDTPALSTSAPKAKFLPARQPVAGEYIVVLQAPTQGVVARDVIGTAKSLVERFGGTPFHFYQFALRGFAVRMTEAQARALSEVPEVAYVQQNGRVSIAESEGNATWGIDRVDQRELPLNQTYLYTASGKGVHAYIIDTGIRVSHGEFGGRADHSFDSVNDGRDGDDCNGHGTHVAGTVGGNVYGVAKNVRLHAVRVLDCQGSGTMAGVVAGVDWVTQNRQLPAVANMSLGGGADQALDDALRRSIAAGVTYVVAAGNDSQDACQSSPARTPEAITVGASTDGDARASFSNWGTCVDLFAPGQNITSSWNTDDGATKVLSGTSMATPHVTGVAALFLERNPTTPPDGVASALVQNATKDKVTNAGSCTPNRLMYTGFLDGRSLKPTQTASDGR